MIPKILMQTSKYDFPEDYINHIKENLPKDWAHFTFNDEQAISYLQNNPIEMFPKIIEVYNSFSNGAHKADLFRYYFMYQNGGLYLDTDAISHVSFDLFIEKSKKNEFYCVENLSGFETCFQGFFGCKKNSKIILKALILAYYTSPSELNDYFKFTKDMFLILRNKCYFAFNYWNWENGVAVLRDNKKNKLISHFNGLNFATKKEIITYY